MPSGICRSGTGASRMRCSVVSRRSRKTPPSRAGCCSLPTRACYAAKRAGGDRIGTARGAGPGFEPFPRPPVDEPPCSQRRVADAATDARSRGRSRDARRGSRRRWGHDRRQACDDQLAVGPDAKDRGGRAWLRPSASRPYESAISAAAPMGTRPKVSVQSARAPLSAGIGDTHQERLTHPEPAAPEVRRERGQLHVPKAST
jgi:hypothetical protein